VQPVRPRGSYPYVCNSIVTPSDDQVAIACAASAPNRPWTRRQEDAGPSELIALDKVGLLETWKSPSRWRLADALIKRESLVAASAVVDAIAAPKTRAARRMDRARGDVMRPFSLGHQARVRSAAPALGNTLRRSQGEAHDWYRCRPRSGSSATGLANATRE